MTPGAALAIGVVSAALPAFLTGWWLRKRTKADAADVITQAAQRVVSQLVKALDDAEATATRLQAEATELRREVHRLRTLVLELGGDPTIGRRAGDAVADPG